VDVNISGDVTKYQKPTFLRDPTLSRLLEGGQKLVDLLIRISNEKIGVGEFSLKQVLFYKNKLP
jgi:hypothetical protein